MRRFTTFDATDRRRLGLLLVGELILAAVLLGRPAAAPPVMPPAVAAVPPPAAAPPSAPATTTLTLPDQRTVELVGLGGRSAQLLDRIAGELAEAVAAVTAFWGADWPGHIRIAAAGTDRQFSALAGVGPDVAAVTTAEGVLFAPGAVGMSADALRIVLRHELFHYAARPVTAADAPRWLTEGVADFVARPQSPPHIEGLTQLPTDTDLDTPGPARSLAYDRAWWFSRYVADRYGTASLRALYLRACGVGHLDLVAAVAETLGSDLDQVLAGWRDWPAR